MSLEVVTRRDASRSSAIYAATLLGVALGAIGVLPQLGDLGIRYDGVFVSDRTLGIVLCLLLGTATAGYAAAGERDLAGAALIGRSCLLTATAMPVVVTAAWLACATSDSYLVVLGRGSLAAGLLAWVAIRKIAEYSLAATFALRTERPSTIGRHRAP